MSTISSGMTVMRCRATPIARNWRAAKYALESCVLPERTSLPPTTRAHVRSRIRPGRLGHPLPFAHRSCYYRVPVAAGQRGVSPAGRAFSARLRSGLLDIGSLRLEEQLEPLFQPRLDLTHALAANPEPGADLLQGRWILGEQAALKDFEFLVLERA